MNQTQVGAEKRSRLGWPEIILALILLFYLLNSLYLSFNLQPAIIPDEPYRYEIARYFADTWGIPKDVPIAAKYGDNLARNPSLGYWIFGRVINLESWIAPESTEFQQLTWLRVFNSCFALGVLILTYCLSKEMIKNSWLQLLPVFLLANTMMFAFLAGGVSYDNPTNFACALGALFFIRILKGEKILSNSLGWLISLLIATLIKYSVAPLLLFTAIIWIINIVRKPGNWISFKPNRWQEYVWITILAALIIGNVLLYGGNLIKFHSLTPDCSDTYSNEICQDSVFVVRQKELGLPEKLTIRQALSQGYPEPIRYFFEVWVRIMSERVFGIAGHKTYYPTVISYYEIAFYWLAFLGFRYVRKINTVIASSLAIILSYAAVLFVMNYNNELVYGFLHIAFQGRYFFPVIGLAYVLVGFILEKVDNKILKVVTIVALLVLFLYGGPIRFFWFRNSVFFDWFI